MDLGVSVGVNIEKSSETYSRTSDIHGELDTGAINPVEPETVLALSDVPRVVVHIHICMCVYVYVFILMYGYILPFNSISISNAYR